MKKLTLITLFFLQQVFSLNQTLHPGYDLITIRPANFQPKVTGIDFLSDGKMILTVTDLKPKKHSTNDEAKIYLLTGTEGTSNAGVTVKEYATGFTDIMDVLVVNDTVYLTERDHLTQLIDKDKDGIPEEKNYLLSDFFKGDRMWATGPVYHQGFFYFSVSVNHTSKKYGDNTLHQYRGCVLKVAKNGTTEILTGGLRNPNGIEKNKAGDIFVTDNQGQWLPHNKFIHAEKGQFYGHDKTPFQPSSGSHLPQDAPAVWLIQGAMNNSPTHPHFLEKGQFTGQFLVGDASFAGGIRRVFIEKVKGKYQGMVLDFGNGFEVGINEINQNSKGEFFAGGLGDSTDWGWKNKLFGLQKFVRNSKSVFEVKAIRSQANAFEVEFSSPAGASAGVLSNYLLKRFGVEPKKAYGGGAKIGERTVSIQSVTLSQDKMRATLTLNAQDLQHADSLMPSTIFHFDFSKIKSASNNGIWTDIAYYTLNNIGPADVLGCMDKNYNEYKSNAQYDDGIQCLTKTTGVYSSDLTLKPKVTVTQTKGVLKVRVYSTENFNVTLYDVIGNKIKSLKKETSGNYVYKDVKGFKGLAFIRIKGKSFDATQRVMIQ